MHYVCFLLFLIVLASSKITNITNIDKWVAKNNYTFALFLAPDCHYCDRLYQALEKASEMISVGSPGSFGVPVVAVKNHTLDYSPVMRLYVQGLFCEVDAEWNQQALEQWMDRRALSYISDTDSEPSIRWIHESYNISVVAFNDSYKEELKLLKHLKYHVHFTYSTFAKARELLAVSEDTTLVMFTDRGYNKYTYEGEFVLEKVFKWVSDHERKYYQEFDEEAIQQVFYHRQKSVLFLFDTQDHKELAKQFQKEQATHNYLPSLETVLVKNSTERLVNFLGVKGILQPLAVIYSKSGKKYRVQYKERAELKQFIQSFLNDNLTPYFKSQTPAKGQNWEHQILELVGTEFPKHDDIFVFFYADWCKASSEAMPHFEELARKYRGKRAFGRFNVQDNEVDDISIKHVPLLRWYNSKDKKVVSWSGPLTVEAMSEFVQKHNTGRVVNEDL